MGGAHLHTYVRNAFADLNVHMQIRQWQYNSFVLKIINFSAAVKVLSVAAMIGTTMARYPEVFVNIATIARMGRKLRRSLVK